MNERQDRFSLDAIDRDRERLAAAKRAANEAGNRSQDRLVALANLPWLIVAIALACWYFFR